MAVTAEASATDATPSVFGRMLSPDLPRSISSMVFDGALPRSASPLSGLRLDGAMVVLDALPSKNSSVVLDDGQRRDVLPVTAPAKGITTGEGPLRRKSFKTLAFLLGFAQGCGLCFFVASGSFFSEKLQNPMFFINACAYFYIPPIAMTVAQLRLDHRFDAALGIRIVVGFRILLSSLVMAALLAALGEVAASAEPGSHQEPLIYGIGAVLGCFAAVLLGSSTLLFGVVDPRLVPLLVLGQTGAGVFANAAARLVGFAPGCGPSQARAFFYIGAGVVAAIAGLHIISDRRRVLESVYRRHGELIMGSQSTSSTSAAAAEAATTVAGAVDELCPEATSVAAAVEAEAATSAAGPVDTRGGQATGSPRGGGMPLLCWSMALCQALAIALNMSLTPLSNQVAHMRYDLAQQLVLTKLLGDFVGRTAFLLLPKPRDGSAGDGGSSRGWDRPRTQAIVVWLVEMCRLPFWVLVWMWAIGAGTAFSFLSSDAVLLWAVWLPLISSGAFSASWCLVIAMSAAEGEARRAAPLVMSCSVYVGFAVGILVALLTPSAMGTAA